MNGQEATTEELIAQYRLGKDFYNANHDKVSRGILDQSVLMEAFFAASTAQAELAARGVFDIN
jgi:hypothetical protein